MGYFLVILLFPLLTLGIVGPALYSRSIERQTTSHMASMIEQVNRNLESQVRGMERLIDLMATTGAVESFLEPGEERSGTRTEISRTLAAVSRSHPEVAGALVVAEDGRWISEGFSRTTRDPLTEELWYSVARERPGEVRLIARPIGRNIRSTRSFGADEVVSVVKAIRGVADGRMHGAVLIDMRLETIEGLFPGSTLDKGGFLFIADSTGELVYAPTNKVAYRLPLAELEEGEGSTLIAVGGIDYQVLSRTSGYTGWKTIGVFSVDESLRELLSLRWLTLAIAAITMLLAVAAAFFFAFSIAKPVLDLRSLMKKVGHGDLTVRFSGAPRDEIGELGLGFNQMIERIERLIDEVYAEQRSKREAELRILQEQIKPHFLYNTLDTIQWMARENRVGDVVAMVGALSSLFRIGLNKGRELIALSDEMLHVESYLCIQKMRYEEKFDYRIACAPELRARRVLRLILQPLVENAIYHGLKERRGHGSLSVEAAVEAMAEGEAIILRVRDDGVGMDGETMARLEASLEEGGQAMGGYGIRNVHERIRLTFGEPYGLSFRSAAGEGTTVTVTHPLLEGEER